MFILILIICITTVSLSLIVILISDSAEIGLLSTIVIIIQTILFILLISAYYSGKFISYDNNIYLNFKTKELKIDKYNNTLQIYDIQFKDSTKNEIIFKYNKKDKIESTIPKF